MQPTYFEDFKAQAKAHKAASRKVSRAVTSTPIVLDERSVKFVLSTPALDRAQDSVKPDGIDLTNYLKNPTVLWGHKQDEFPVGRCTHIAVEAGELVGVVEFADADIPIAGERAEACLRLCKSGALNAVSIGFRPKTWEFNDAGGLDILESELLEFSIVTVPCNQEALVVETPELQVPDAGKQAEPEVQKSFARNRRARFLDING